jgi:hypothetical protein
MVIWLFPGSNPRPYIWQAVIGSVPLRPVSVSGDSHWNEPVPSLRFTTQTMPAPGALPPRQAALSKSTSARPAMAEQRGMRQSVPD